MEQKPPGLFAKISIFASVSGIIVILSVFSVYIHYDFVFYPKLPKVVYSQSSGWQKPKHSTARLIQKGYDFLSMLFMALNGFFILYRYFIAFTTSPGTFTREKNEKI